MKVVKFNISIFAVLAAAFACSACDTEKDEQCNCVDNKGNKQYISTVSQECSDLSTPTLRCYPAD